ncbi:hypothetical protein HQQ94_13810 [Shewanella sp. VB17]|uniref:hypothetical protein n=1 Tax=Shewanella sp. VB17 TaxID=2739432 RepID=UPI0015674272|nr:hypothetical protein [Shewanella sp. VB17]NRD74293.1 hypothetical protein [Shewanella sp. VB17]
MMNVFILTVALISMTDNENRQERISKAGSSMITMSHSKNELLSSSVSPALAHITSEELSMEIKANLETAFERILTEMDQELTNNIKSDSTNTLYSQKD